MRQVLDALARLEERGRSPATPNEIAYEIGFDRGQTGARTARDGRAMAPAQRVITPLTALRGRGLVALSRRRDDLSGTAYCLTDEGRAAPRT